MKWKIYLLLYTFLATEGQRLASDNKIVMQVRHDAAEIASNVFEQHDPLKTNTLSDPQFWNQILCGGSKLIGDRLSRCFVDGLKCSTFSPSTKLVRLNTIVTHLIVRSNWGAECVLQAVWSWLIKVWFPARNLYVAKILEVSASKVYRLETGWCLNIHASNLRVDGLRDP